jgi:acyl-CoA thioester hydrolase
MRSRVGQRGERPRAVQVLSLPELVTRTVPLEYIDANGHINVVRYFELCADGLAAYCEWLRLGLAYIADRGLSTFAAEQHLRYYAQVLEGHEVSVHARLLDRSARALHVMVYLLNRTQGVVAMTFESAIVHVRVATRRPAEFPTDVAGWMDAELAKSDELGWKTIVSTSIGVRRPLHRTDEPDG